MKKLTAILLAMLMVCFCFATTAMADETTEDVTLDVTSDDATSDDATSDDATSDDVASVDPQPEYINVAAGKTYTIIADDGDAQYNGAYDDGMGEGYYLTDGIVRDVEQLTSAGEGDMDKTVELAGTYRTHFVTIDLGAAQNVGRVALGTIRRGNNRYTNIASIEVLVNGAWVPVVFEETAVAIEGAGQYGDETAGIEPYDQFFNVYADFQSVTTTSIRIGLDTLNKETNARGYIAHLDEIEVCTVIMPETPGNNGSTDTSADASIDSSIDDTTSTAPVTPSTPSAGDLGLGVFAVLAVVSLAGVVVAKKVK